MKNEKKAYYRISDLHKTTRTGQERSDQTETVYYYASV